MTSPTALLLGPGLNWVPHTTPCGTDPERFWPDSHRIKPDPQTAALCAACPVTTQCLQYALTTSAPGIWGGTTEAQRHQLRTGQPARTPRPDTTPPPPDPRVDYRRKAAVTLLNLGVTPTDVATRLNISQRTVERYRRQAGAA